MTQVSIASGSQLSADAGAAVANRGGNAVDAAIATALVSMCTNPAIMAPGGSGFITIWAPGENPIVIDAYAEMPGRGLDRDRLKQGGDKVFMDYGGGMHTQIGYGSIATPGMFAGLGLGWEKYGAIPWAEVVQPGIEAAEQGFPLSRGSAEYLHYSHEIVFGWHPDSYRTVHHPDGRYLTEGETVHIEHLAETLKLIAQEGVKTFYTGELADRMVAEIQSHDGILTAADLAAYEAIVRSPISTPFGDWQVVTNPAPAIGGACLAGMLRLLDDPSLKASDPMTVKRVAEVQKFILDYRHQHLETANDIAAEVKELLNKVAHSGNGLTSPSTIHCSAVDSNGLACAITASAGYGSGVMISGTGLWLNNSLGEIELHPHGLENLAPGTRLSSNMAPTIARRDDGSVMAIGSPGASRITTAIAQVLFNFVRLGMSLSEAIDYSRLHVEIFENAPTISYEPGLNVDAISGFKLRQFPQKFMYFGGVHAALWNPQTGLSEMADPRRGGGMARGGL